MDHISQDRALTSERCIYANVIPNHSLFLLAQFYESEITVLVKLRDEGFHKKVRGSSKRVIPLTGLSSQGEQPYSGAP